MDIVLLAAALIPAIALMAYVYSKDKVEPEPIGLVARVFIFGAISGLVAGGIELLLIDVFEAIIPPGVILLVVTYFIGVAAVEESCKFLCLNTVKNNPEFNYVFDAVVYSVAAALGFAALENVFYVLDGGLETALLRAILSVPGHAADGVVMGVFYGIARQHELHGQSDSTGYYLLAWLLPVIEHGFYDAALSAEDDIMAIVAILFDLAFIAIAFYLIKNTAAADTPLHPQMAQQQYQPVQQFQYQPQPQPFQQQQAQPHQPYQPQAQPYQPQAQPYQQPYQQPQQQAQPYQPQQQAQPYQPQSGPTVRYSSHGDGNVGR